jgi:hypothetical protein
LNTRATTAIQEQDLELNSIASFSVNWKEALKISPLPSAKFVLGARGNQNSKVTCKYLDFLATRFHLVLEQALISGI